MEITNVETTYVEVDVRPLERRGGIAPYAFGHGSLETSDRMLVRLDTDGDVVGWGELNPVLSPESTASLIETDIGSEVVGRDVWAVEDLLEVFDWVDPYMGNNPALGAVEMAMWDAFGKHLGVPVHRLLGGKIRDTVEFACCLGILDLDQSRAKARELRDEGFTTIKTKGGRDWRDDVDRIVAMQEAVGDDVDLRVDPNRNWSVEDAVRMVARLEDEGVFLQYLEQPIDVDRPETLESLRSRLRTPIAVNEDLYLPNHDSLLAATDAIDVGVADLIPAGGLLAMKKLAAVLGAHGVSLTHHNSFDFGIKTAAILHLVATTPAYNLAPDTTYYALADRFIEEPFAFDDGELAVPDDPGLGVTVDRDAIARNRVPL